MKMPRPGYWHLVAAGEPFRLLFPLGIGIGLFGVLMWPLHIWNVAGAYPGLAHARIMIEGFLTCFVIGFLGTAFPRLLDVPRMTLLETLGFAVMLLWTVWLHYSGRTFWGDQVFFATLCYFLLALGVRALFRQDVPPPGFVLVGLGLISALVGAGMMTAMHVSPQMMPDWAGAAGRLFLYQGYLLLPIMGVGAFLLPRFFGLPNKHDFPESLLPPPGWVRRAAFALVCGLAVLASFVLEALGEIRWGCALRAAVVLVYFFCEVPIHKARYGGGSLALGLRVALLSIPLGYVLMAVWPQQLISWLHVVFISGFGLLTLTVASRVVLGHSGQAEKIRATLWPVVTMVSLVVLAMATRVSADWMPDTRMSHYAYAALAWAAGVLIWAVFILPGVRRAENET